MKDTTEQDQRPESLAERRTEALQMRLTGSTYAEIAEHFGYSKSRAHADVVAAMADVNRDTPEHVLGRQLSILAEMRAALWPAALGGDVDAVGAVLVVMDHEALLLGLYAPTKTEHTITTTAPGNE